MENCSRCNAVLDAAERLSGRGLCDLCVILAIRAADRDELSKRNLLRIPPEYRNLGIMGPLKAKTGIEEIRTTNIYAKGTKHRILNLKWAILEDVWSCGKNVLPVNYLSWHAEYQSPQVNKYEMLMGIVDYRGYVVIDADNMYGIDDQSVLYSILQIRGERGRNTCLLVCAENATAESLIFNAAIRSFLNDEVNKYKIFTMYGN